MGRTIAQIPTEAAVPILGNVLIEAEESTGSVRGLVADIRNAGVQVQSGAYAMTSRSEARIIAWTVGASDVDIDLPASSVMIDGDVIEIIRLDSGAGIGSIVPAGSDTIGGKASLDLMVAYDYAKMMLVGTDWIVVAVRATYSDNVASTKIITGEFIFDEDALLDYGASITDGGSGTITFTELPISTVAIWVQVYFEDSGTAPGVRFKRRSASTETRLVKVAFADRGSNFLAGTYWLPTWQNSIYYDSAAVDAGSDFRIIGYKTGA